MAINIQLFTDPSTDILCCDTPMRHHRSLKAAPEYHDNVYTCDTCRTILTTHVITAPTTTPDPAEDPQ